AVPLPARFAGPPPARVATLPSERFAAPRAVRFAALAATPAVGPAVFFEALPREARVAAEAGAPSRFTAAFTPALPERAGAGFSAARCTDLSPAVASMRLDRLAGDFDSPPDAALDSFRAARGALGIVVSLSLSAGPSHSFCTAPCFCQREVIQTMLAMRPQRPSRRYE